MLRDVLPRHVRQKVEDLKVIKEVKGVNCSQEDNWKEGLLCNLYFRNKIK